MEENINNFIDHMSYILALNINFSGQFIFIRDTRIFVYGLITSVISKLGILEILIILCSTGEIDPQNVRILIICILITLINYMISTFSSEIVGIEIRKIGYMYLIRFAALSAVLTYFYQKYYNILNLSIPLIYFFYNHKYIIYQGMYLCLYTNLRGLFTRKDCDL